MPQEVFNQGSSMLILPNKNDEMINPFIQQTSNHERPIMCQIQEMKWHTRQSIPDIPQHKQTIM